MPGSIPGIAPDMIPGTAPEMYPIIEEKESVGFAGKDMCAGAAADASDAFA